MSKLPSTDLFDLIKSLTKSEKRHFKLYTSRRNGNNISKYVHLFNSIDKMGVYDESKLLERNPALNANAFKSMKSYLYDLILRSLRDTLKDHLPIAEIRYQLDKAAILIAKRLYPQATRLLERLKEVAIEKEYLPSLIEIIELEDYLKVRHGKVISSEHHNQLYQELASTIAQQQQRTEYRHLTLQFHYFHRNALVAQSDKEQSDLDMLMSHPLLKDSSLATTFLSKARFLQIHFLHATLQEDEVGAYNHLYELVELFNAHPTHRTEHLYMYAHALGNFLDQCLALGKMEEFERYSTILKTLEDDCYDHPDWVDIALCRRLSQLLYVRSQYLFNQIQPQINEFQSFLTIHESRIHQSILVMLYSQFATFNMIIGEYEQSLYWTGKLLNDPHATKYSARIELAKWLNIINHFELRNETALESALRSMYRYLRKREILYGTDELMLGFLKRIVRVTERERVQEIFKIFYQELQNTSEGSQNETVGRTWIDAATWLRSKIENKPLTQILIEQRTEKTVTYA